MFEICDEFIRQLVKKCKETDTLSTAYIMLEEENQKYFDVGLIYMYFYDNIKEVKAYLHIYEKVISRECAKKRREEKKHQVKIRLTNNQNIYLRDCYKVYDMEDTKKYCRRKEAVIRCAVMYGKYAMKFRQNELKTLLVREIQNNRTGYNTPTNMNGSVDRRHKNYIDTDWRNKMKLANYRLRELEKADMTKSSNAYRYLDDTTNVSTDRANSLNGVIRYDSKDRPRFSESFNNYDLRDNWKQAEIEVDRFLNANTSTVTGTKEKYYKAYQKFREDHNKDLSFDEYSQYFQKAEGKNSILRELPSDIIVLGISNMSPDEVENINNKFENARTERQEIEAINEFIKRASEEKKQGFFSRLKQRVGNINFNRKTTNQRKKAIKNLHKKESKFTKVFNKLFRK